MGDAEGGAHYRSRKHDNFDIGRGRVQISVLVTHNLEKPFNLLSFYSLKISIEDRKMENFAEAKFLQISRILSKSLKHYLLFASIKAEPRITIISSKFFQKGIP